ncbi:S1 family peptidase [Natronoglycomyces albus]|uniref:S1 family peptidase n=1 Tax=Natronoglycomyces albus TaxID=2811108 RepID=A0A895XTR6_9ACTN|nr:S1 family peptidase [Natronoglycomyces albus]QSB05916.1 S1 family peptidase [Natronoglycomyces albus]
MKTKRIVAASAAAIVASAGVLALNTSASAHTLEAEINDARADLVGNVDTNMLEAMTEHFDISVNEAYDRLALESVATTLEADLASEAGFAGLWIAENGEDIIVASTSGVSITANEVTVIEAKYTLDELEYTSSQFNPVAEAASDYGIHGWYVDVMDNSVVLEAATTDGAKEFASLAGVDSSNIVIDISSEAPQTAYVAGGILQGTNTSSCSVGFAVLRGNTKGFVTAGHCGRVGAQVTRGNPAPGIYRNSVFPGADAAFVEVASNKTLYPLVRTSSSWTQVNNATEAPIGASICRSGITTGWRCGSIQAKNQTVNYSQGAVHGMTRTSACVNSGDSGGSFISGSSAQGVTSGGLLGCGGGNTWSVFQPIWPMLNSWNLTLVTQQVN